MINEIQVVFVCHMYEVLTNLQRVINSNNQSLKKDYLGLRPFGL